MPFADGTLMRPTRRRKVSEPVLTAFNDSDDRIKDGYITQLHPTKGFRTRAYHGFNYYDGTLVMELWRWLFKRKRTDEELAENDRRR